MPPSGNDSMMYIQHDEREGTRVQCTSGNLLWGDASFVERGTWAYVMLARAAHI